MVIFYQAEIQIWMWFVRLLCRWSHPVHVVTLHWRCNNNPKSSTLILTWPFNQCIMWIDRHKLFQETVIWRFKRGLSQHKCIQTLCSSFVAVRQEICWCRLLFWLVRVLMSYKHSSSDAIIQPLWLMNTLKRYSSRLFPIEPGLLWEERLLNVYTRNMSPSESPYSQQYLKPQVKHCYHVYTCSPPRRALK